MREIILVAGKPGAGKSIATKLAAAEVPKARHLSIGNHLRAIKDGTARSAYASKLLLDSQVRYKLDHSLPLPAALVNGVFEEFLVGWDGPVFVDGYPRYSDRLPAFDATIARTGSKVLAICRVEIDDHVAQQRLSNRPPRSSEGVEDAAFHEKRLEDYNKYVLPTILALGRQHPAHIIDGNQRPEKVADTIVAIYNDSHIGQN